MNISAPFIRRPVATSLLTVALLLYGSIAFRELPVASLPQVAYPVIQVQSDMPGANAETVASSIATPLERMFGRIAGVNQMTSLNRLGRTQIVLQFDLDRDIDAAARDVQAAINSARGQLPANLPTNPSWRKVNPAEAPIMVMALTSDTATQEAMFDVADSILAQKLQQIPGIGQVAVGGSSQPAVRAEVNPLLLSKLGISLDQVRTAINGANAHLPKGALSDQNHTIILDANDQLFRAEDYGRLIIAYNNRAPVHLSDVATVIDGQVNNLNTGLINGKPMVELDLFRQPSANIIDTVDRVKAVLPLLRASIPPSINLTAGARPHGNHSRVRARRRGESDHFDRSGGPGDFCLSPQHSGHSHSRRGRAGIADRNLWRHVPAGLFHRQSFTDGADHFNGLCGGRRHRRH